MLDVVGVKHEQRNKKIKKKERKKEREREGGRWKRNTSRLAEAKAAHVDPNSKQRLMELRQHQADNYGGTNCHLVLCHCCSA